MRPQAFVASAALVLVVSLLTVVVDAYPTGAGSCPAGEAAVGGSHKTMDTIESGDLDDYGIELAIDGITLSSSAPFEVTVGEDHTWELYSGSNGFRGFLLRLDGGTEKNVDNTAALGNLPGMGGMVQVADVCTTEGVGGATHRSRLLKSSVSGSLFLGQESRNMQLDVTVVVKNQNGKSEYYYSAFTLDAVAAAATTTTPAPVAAATNNNFDFNQMNTPPPMAAPVAVAVAAETDEPTQTDPPETQAPSQRPVPDPTSPPVVPEEEEQGEFLAPPTYVPTWHPTYYPTFSTTQAPQARPQPTDPHPEVVVEEEEEQVLEPTFIATRDDDVWNSFDDGPPTIGSFVAGHSGPTMAPTWPPLESIFPTCSENNTCTVCEGDCDTDLDCEGHFACFQRDFWDYTPVPGCQGYGLMGRDYCFDPWVYPTALRSGPEDCTAERPCAKCEGDCDGDDQCQGHLECFHRFNGSNNTVPGCYGHGYPGRDYCFDRADMPTAFPRPVGPVPTTQSPSVEASEAASFEDTSEETEEPVACSHDTWECPDGQFVGRVPPLCEFPPCPAPPPACPQDVMQCPSGDIVVRLPPDCNFGACPQPEAICTQDVWQCPSGDYVGRVPPTCEFEECPDLAVCTQDVFQCPDGGYVGRNPANNCEFFACPIYDVPGGPPPPPVLRETECTESQPCGECFGDCDQDSECEDDLECRIRRVGELTRIPGCMGQGLPGYDYCYKPDPQSLRPRIERCTPQKPCLKCQGDCDSDADCQGSLSCFIRRSSQHHFVPGCSGEQHGNIDYCYDPSDDTYTGAGASRHGHLRRPHSEIDP